VRTEVFAITGEVHLDLSIKSGHARLMTHDQPSVEIEVMTPRNPEFADQLKIEHVVTRGRDQVLVAPPAFSAGGLFGGQRKSEVDLVIRLPHGAAVLASTASAPIDAIGRYGSVRVNSASGPVQLDQVDGELTIQTASGRVGVASVAGPAKIRTASGDVEVGAAGARLDVATASGDIHAGSANECHFRSASGDQTVDVAVSGAVELVTSSGDVSVGVARGAIIRVDAETVSGELRSDIDLDDEPGDGVPTDGADQITLKIRTVSGDVRVKRAVAVTS
jgi:hypothetical protein